MQISRWTLLAIGAFAVCQPAAALEPYVVIDTFTDPKINFSRWSESERVRAVVGGQLRLAQRDHGLTTRDTDRNGLSWSETVSRGGPVTQLRALVRVIGYEAAGCAANPQGTRVRARLLGTFFNTGNRSSGSNVGDVLAQIYLLRDSSSVAPSNELAVEASLFMCTSSDCNVGTSIGGPVSLGTANVGQGVVLQIEWDRANNRFVFGRDYGATTANIAYTVDDAADPGSVFKSVGTRVDAANCASAAPGMGFIDARFDTVNVNSTAKP
jgi:hypothetical protein